MGRTWIWVVVMLLMGFGRGVMGAPVSEAGWPDGRFSIGPLLYREDFETTGLANWAVELERGGTVIGGGGRLDIDVPGGATVWFRKELVGPVLISYDAVVVGKGGINDRVSDLNCFWMAQDPKLPGHLLDVRRSGKFSDYDGLQLYYVGQGGNGNTTTRFRRYVGEAGNRPLRAEDDLKDGQHLLTANVTQTIRLVAFGGLIEYFRDDRRLFEMQDSVPYVRGWFGIRTTESHITIRHLRIYRLLARRVRASTAWP